jgi:glycosyltransferase involved in cell wall biosynthesis
LVKISVVFGFRNRELIRVKRCIDSLADQSFKDFEVIFVDYGSDEDYSMPVKDYLKAFDFISYYYNDTRGMPWNRAHVLNTGVRLAEGEFILFTDIDMVFVPSFMEVNVKQLIPTKQFYQPIYWLPEDFKQYDKLASGQLIDFNTSGTSGKGGLHFISKKALEEIGGYDEYFCFWGREDLDLFGRLELNGIQTNWFPPNKVPVYHQWHPLTSTLSNSQFPDKWWEDMSIYYYLNKNKIVRNPAGWGEILHPNTRKSLMPEHIDKEVLFEPKDSIFGEGSKTEFIERLFNAWDEVSPGKNLRISIKKEHQKLQGNLLKQRIVNWFNMKQSKRFKLLLIQEHVLNENYKYRADHFIFPEDILYVLWNFVHQSYQIKDYFMEQTDNHYITIISKPE